MTVGIPQSEVFVYKHSYFSFVYWIIRRNKHWILCAKVNLKENYEFQTDNL